MDTMPDYKGITGASSEENFSIRNNYKFDALIRAIDFFSQKFNLETLIDFSGDFINEILTLGASAVFVYDKTTDCFTATKMRLYKTHLNKIPNSKGLQKIARFYGSIISKDFEQFFDVEFINAYKPSLLIPIINGETLLGFILTEGKAIGALSDEDLQMATAIMHLFNDAFERHNLMEQLDARDKKLNEKVFETINKASRMLFSEINMEALLTTGIEIFSEISGSMHTAFGVLDLEKHAIKVRAYTDIKTNAQCPDDFYLDLVKDPEFMEDKYLYLFDAEKDKLEKIFADPGKFEIFNTKYVVLIVKDEILGFVTLSKYLKTGNAYSEETLELINSLVLACFIALQNAILFESISVQRDEMEAKYNSLLKMFR